MLTALYPKIIHRTILTLIFSVFVITHGNANPHFELLHKLQQGDPLPTPAFPLLDQNLNTLTDYSNYGEFVNVGTSKYRYKVKDSKGLQDAVGAGIYPNEHGVHNEGPFMRLQQKGMLEGSHWDYLDVDDLQRAFYKWTQAQDSQGVRLFFTAQTLEKAGHIIPAIKAYYAILVHFPGAPCWSSDGTYVWYLGPSALSSIKRLCRTYPRLGIDLVGADIKIKNGQDTNLENDIVTANPGRFIKKTLKERTATLPDLTSLEIVEQRGHGTVQVVKFSNGHWQLRVHNKPYFVKGISYFPTVIGIGPHNDSLFGMRWMFSDENQNGRIDAPYDAWVDQNKNGRQDKNEPAVGDFQLMKNMGGNTIRFFPANNPSTQYDPSLLNKPLLRDLYHKYGIMTIVGDFLGAYTVGSGADWETGTDYTDPKQRQRMKDIVRQKVLDLKDEPFVLMWLLGNENNMPGDFSGVNATRTNAAAHPKAYAQFLNEVAEMIHEIDGNHPVMVGNLELGLLEYYKKYAPAIDILGINSYRGKNGFGMLWEDAKKKFDRPVLIKEYGCDAYYDERGEDEDGQLEYHKGALRDIVFNQAGGLYTGNSIGGILFEYLDEWWKDTTGHPEDAHQMRHQSTAPFPDGKVHEEWFGIVGQGSGKNSPFERHLRKTYYFYQDMWAGNDSYPLSLSTHRP